MIVLNVKYAEEKNMTLYFITLNDKNLRHFISKFVLENTYFQIYYIFWTFIVLFCVKYVAVSLHLLYFPFLFLYLFRLHN